MSFFKSSKLTSNSLTIFTLILLGVGFRLINFTDGLWLDEIWSMVTSSVERSVTDIINDCKEDTHPPLFDLLLHYFLVLFGENEINGRVLSLIIGVIGMLTTHYYTLRITGNKTTAFLSLYLISFSYFHIYYSTEGRFYTLLYLLSLSIICQLYFYLKNNNKIQLILFLFSSLILVYTHYYGAILLLGLAIIVLILWIFKEINNKQFLRFSLSGFIILAMYSPWVPYMFARESNSSWMNAPSIFNFFEYLYGYTGKNPVEFILILLALLFSIKQFKTNKILYSLLIGNILLGFLIPFIVSYISVPMLHFRYTFIYFPSVILVTAIFWEQTTFLSNEKKKVLFFISSGSFIINFFFINDYTNGIHTEPWKEVAMEITKNEKSVIITEQAFHLNYYLNKQELNSESTLKRSPSSFYFLQTPYDANTGTYSKEYKIEKSIDYGNGFVLIFYKK